MTHDPPVHASCVAIGDDAILIRGQSGAGKSDLALRLIDRGAMLVSDDYVHLHAKDDALWASPPETIKGKIEVRGLGIIDMPYRELARVRLCVDLTNVEYRFPFDEETVEFQGQRITRITLDPHHASTPIKVEYALKTKIALK